MKTSVRLQQIDRGLPWAAKLPAVVDRRTRALRARETSPSKQADAAAVCPAMRPGPRSARSPQQQLAASDLRALGRSRSTTALPGAPSPFQRGGTSWAPHVTSVHGVEPINELVVVDAKFGAVALHFDQIETALNRRICDVTRPPPGARAAPVRTEGESPVADTSMTLQGVRVLRRHYNFYFNRFGRDSLNNAGLTLDNTVDYCPSPAPTARTPTRSGTGSRWSTATATPGRRRRRARAHPRGDGLHLASLLLRAIRGDQRVDVRRHGRVHRPDQRRRQRHAGGTLEAGRGPARLPERDPQHEGPDRLRRSGPDAEPQLHRRPERDGRGRRAHQQRRQQQDRLPDHRR